MAQGTVHIDQARCKGCNLCVAACPQDVLELDAMTLNAKGYHPAILNETNKTCTGCAVCAVVCPDVCFTVYREPRSIHRPQMASAS